MCVLVYGQTPVDNTDSRSEDLSSGSSEKIALKEKDWKLTRAATEWSVQTAYAPMQPTFFSGRKEYDTDGRKFAMLSFRYGRVIGTTRGVTYEYLFESSPYAIAINNEVGYKDGTAVKNTWRSNTLGITIQPAGFRFVFLPNHRLKPYAQTAAGFIFSRRPIPVPQGTNYNFIGDFGGGVMYSFTKQQVLKAGYRYYHISNMNIGELNPGYNANMFYFDMSLFSK
jgi:hypothetical protein